MKIKTRTLPYEKAAAMKRPEHKPPLRPNLLLTTAVRALSCLDLWPVHFTCRRHGMEKLGRKEPCLILMNHSSFIDLKIVSGIFYPRPYGIVCTTDALVGKKWLMRLLGCIPTQKFVNDVTLIRDMEYMLKEKKTSVLMYPEAGYSFDGKATTLPRKLGVLLKKLGAPVVTVITQGAFARDPLYNGLQLRKVPVSADVTYLLSPQDLKEKTVAQLDAMLDEAFSFDNFRWQQEQGLRITEPFRADGLSRILFKCPHCLAEGKAQGKGTKWVCGSCGKTYELTEEGSLRATDGETKFSHVPDWYQWERDQVRQELEDGTYGLDVPVDIAMLVDHKALYRVGTGRLTHGAEGFTLTGCDGKLHYTQGPLASHCLNADYFWYEIGDVISIGSRDALYYCFPQNCGDVVAKTRLAAEELYKMKKQRRPSPKPSEAAASGTDN